jgi:uncharacterized protein
MLSIAVSQIPPDGLVLQEELAPAAVHLEGDEEFRLEGGRLAARVEKGDDEAVHVRGTLRASLELACARCLDRFRVERQDPVELYFLPGRSAREEEEEVELSDRELVVGYYENDRLDLGEAVREHLVLSVPMKPVCRPECRGLCPICGGNRNLEACACREAPDTPLAGLQALLQRRSGDQ